MEINFDFLLAGCNTRCRHCYVNGGPGPMMTLEDALLCLEKLDALAAHLPEGTSFTLDHEPMNHPQLDQILHAASRTKHIVNFHHGMTTGIALMRRGDKNDAMRAYFENGYDTFGITIHGSAVHHDEIVRRNGAYQKSVETAEFVKQGGARLEVSLMLNRFFAEDAEELTELVERLKPDDLSLGFPIFTPHCNMMDFEPYRATVETVEALRGYMGKWGLNEAKLMQEAKTHTIAAAVQRLRRRDLHDLFSQPQNELYLTVHPDCKLYVGNSGQETDCLGDLRLLDPNETAGIINSLPGNRDYGGFYDLSALPNTEKLCCVLERLTQSLIYGDFESVLYRGLTELGTPTRIIAVDHTK